TRLSCHLQNTPAWGRLTDFAVAELQGSVLGGCRGAATSRASSPDSIQERLPTTGLRKAVPPVHWRRASESELVAWSRSARRQKRQYCPARSPARSLSRLLRAEFLPSARMIL